FFPMIFYVIASNFIRFKKIDIIQLSLSLFLILSFVYILVGFPLFLSKITLLSMSEARRFLPIAEAGNCILLICFLSDRQFHKKNKNSWIEFAILTIACVIFFILAGKNINKASGNFFTIIQLITMVFIFTLVYLLIRYK